MSLLLFLRLLFLRICVHGGLCVDLFLLKNTTFFFFFFANTPFLLFLVIIPVYIYN